MKHCKLLSIDLAKTVFQLCGMDLNNHVILNKKVTRRKLVESVLQVKPDAIVMESCYSANHWGRQFQALGFKVKLIPPQHVKPFVKGNKNDHHDAVAICEASLRPNIHFVPVKTFEQQDLQAMHRIRQRLIRDRTSLVNQTRGLLSEYGIIMTRSYHVMKTQLPLIIEDMSNQLSFLMREMLNDMLDELRISNHKIEVIEQKIEQTAAAHPQYQPIMQIPGIGLITASAILAQVGDAKQFKSARGFAAWLGLTPKHQASGTKIVNQGMSKRGDRYLRTLLIHGGRIVLSTFKQDCTLKRFAKQVEQRRGKHKAVVATAHKMARIIWAVLNKGQAYNPEYTLTQK
ncbi:IS110 family transposase [Marinicella pacifica]|uniref:IS110 family transposase n=2 Tax=Marinicella pacifica TaxID=1171543 RepID=A0A917CZ71_9GAMM|nr:IS110 family transposase [Marinicella pacifica]GGG03637.1 IS110 family transposase [Marinicella pacifica]